MNDANTGPKVEPLKKVTLTVEAGASPEAMNLTPAPKSFDFVFGVGAEGLTSFEYGLAGKSEGEEALIRLKPEEVRSLPVNIFAPFSPTPPGGGDLYVKATVVRVLPAENREVIRAMAGSGGCGGDCCGGHSE